MILGLKRSAVWHIISTEFSLPVVFYRPVHLKVISAAAVRTFEVKAWKRETQCAVSTLDPPTACCAVGVVAWESWRGDVGDVSGVQLNCLQTVAAVTYLHISS